MKVSIITVSYNSETTIEETIQSVLSQKQTHNDLEYIIIDGASKDGTLEIIEKYKDEISKVISEKDFGIYDAMNKGIKMATGDVIGILNSDDLFSDNKVIADIVKLFESSKCQATYSDLVYVDKDDINKVIRYWKSGEYKSGDFKKGWMPPHPTFFVKKESYDQLGSFNLALKTSADYELMLRFIHKHELSVKYLPRVCVRMRVGGQSNVSIRNRIKANQEDRKAWKINNIKPSPLTFIRKPFSKILQFTRKVKK